MAAATQFLMPASDAERGALLRLETKRMADTGLFEGYASLFDREDLGHDVIAPGAFAESLAKRGAADIRMLFQHNPAQPIGVWEVVQEDGRGLYVRGQLTPGVAKADEVLALMKAGALDGLSIGFKALKARRDAKSGIRRIEKIDLWEISVVTFPMLPGARVTSVKQRPFASAVPSEREFERWLARDAGLTRSEARAVVRDGYSGLRAAQRPVPAIVRAVPAITRGLPAPFAVRVRDVTTRLAGETAQMRCAGALPVHDIKSAALRVAGDVAYLRMLAAVERLKMVVAGAPAPQDVRAEKFNPDQPRVPAGNSDGGRWTSGGGGVSGGNAGVVLAAGNGNDLLTPVLDPGSGGNGRGDGSNGCAAAFAACEGYAMRLFDLGHEQDSFTLRQSCFEHTNRCLRLDAVVQSSGPTQLGLSLFPPDYHKGGGGVVLDMSGKTPAYIPPATDPLSNIPRAK